MVVKGSQGCGQSPKVERRLAKGPSTGRSIEHLGFMVVGSATLQQRVADGLHSVRLSHLAPISATTLADVRRACAEQGAGAKQLEIGGYIPLQTRIEALKIRLHQ